MLFWKRETRGRPKKFPPSPDWDLEPRTWSSLKRPIVTREEWRALPPREVVPFTFPLKHVLFTQTSTAQCFNKDECVLIIQQLQKKHMEEGHPDIRFNFLVGSDKNIYEGRGWNARPDLNEKYPKLFQKNMEYAYIGTYEEDEPDEMMQRSAWDLVEDALLEDKLVIKFRVAEDYFQYPDLDSFYMNVYNKIASGQMVMPPRGPNRGHHFM